MNNNFTSDEMEQLRKIIAAFASSNFTNFTNSTTPAPSSDFPTWPWFLLAVLAVVGFAPNLKPWFERPPSNNAGGGSSEAKPAPRNLRERLARRINPSGEPDLEAGEVPRLCVRCQQAPAASAQQGPPTTAHQVPPAPTTQQSPQGAARQAVPQQAAADQSVPPAQRRQAGCSQESEMPSEELNAVSSTRAYDFRHRPGRVTGDRPISIAAMRRRLYGEEKAEARPRRTFSPEE